MSYNFIDKTINIDVERNADNTATLDASRITVSASLSDYTTSGEVNVKLDVKLPEGYTLKSKDLTVKAELKSNNSETKAEETATKAGTTNTTER